MLIFKLSNLLLISTTLACNVGLFQRTCLLIHPAASTPELVQCSFVYGGLYTHWFALCLYVLCNPLPLSVQMKPSVLPSIRESNVLSGVLDFEIMISSVTLLYESYYKTDNTKLKTNTVKTTYL